jgi:hypothetical protein
MGEVTFLPWLGLNERTKVAGVSFVPWQEFRQSRELPEEERRWLERYFSRYRQLDGKTAVNTVTIAQSDEGDRRRILGVVRATAAAHMVYEHAECLGGSDPTMGPPRGERWQVLTQRFDPSKDWVALPEGYTTVVLPLDTFVEIEPLSAGDLVGGLDRPVVKMAEALVRRAEDDEDLAVAVDLLVEGAKTSDAHVRRLNFVFLGTALELLAGAGGQRDKGRRIGDALREAVEKAGRGCRTATDALGKALTRARKADPALVRIWMASCDACDGGSCSMHAEPYVGWYRRRNKVIHKGRAGREVLLHQRPDNGKPHEWSTPVGASRGAHACDVALVMSGWLLLDRVGEDLSCEDWWRWCHQLDRAAEAMGMG